MKTRITACLFLSLMLSTGLLVAGPTGSASAGPGTILNPTDTGWYREDGTHDPANQNYVVGRPCCEPSEYRDYFSFDLSTVLASGDPITDAALNLTNPAGSGTVRTFQLHDVSTSLVDLDKPYSSAEPFGVTIFQDLGSGTLLGSVTPATVGENPLSVPMNAKGLAALNAARGSTISLGGSLVDSAENDFILGGTFDSSVELTLTLGSTTKLTIKAPSRVPKGTRAKISGKLSATPAATACTAAQTLKISVGTKQLTRTTAASGSYSFKTKIAKKTKVTIRYAANANCTASSVSKIIRVS